MSKPGIPFKSVRHIDVAHAGIITKRDNDQAAQHASMASNWLKNRNITVEINTITPEMDLLVILGGDGTLLHIAEQAARYSIPVTGINLGNLGFLTEYSRDETIHALERVLSGSVTVENRLMLKTRVIRGEKYESYRYALNDIVINKHTLDRLLHLATHAGDDYITTYKADGLIFSSPTGSTAYNLSAGGPIVYPGLETIMVTPICPFMLSSRPILLPASTVITAEFESNGNAKSAHVIVDGQQCWEMLDGNKLEVAPAEHPLLLIGSSTRDYFTILRNKLHWGNQDYRK